MSIFDASAFLDSTVTDSNSTVSIPVPAGEFTAVITKVEARQWTSKNDPSKSGVALDVVWEIDSPEVAAVTGRDKNTVKQGIMLDLTESGGLDMSKGKNVNLGRLREAVNLNESGRPFAFSMLNGQCARITVSHRIDGDTVYADVKGVAKLG